MINNCKCSKVKALFMNQDEILGGPIEKTFGYEEDGIKYGISIFQLRDLTIEISANSESEVKKIYDIMIKVEKLLMLFSGRFVTLKDLSFYKVDDTESSELKGCAEEFKNKRLNYFFSSGLCKYEFFNLLNFDEVLTDKLFSDWCKLLEELGVAYQVYLYVLSNIKITVDIKASFMIELAEPMVEIVKSQTGLFSSLTPGEHGTTLKTCLDALISKYGEDIFANEFKKDYVQFLQKLVYSRVNIMHIKLNEKKPTLSKEKNEYNFYIMKLDFLYRKIIFELLSIDEKMYKNKLVKAIECLDDYNEKSYCQ